MKRIILVLLTILFGIFNQVVLAQSKTENIDNQTSEGSVKVTLFKVQLKYEDGRPTKAESEEPIQTFALPIESDSNFFTESFK